MNDTSQDSSKTIVCLGLPVRALGAGHDPTYEPPITGWDARSIYSWPNSEFSHTITKILILTFCMELSPKRSNVWGWPQEG